MTSRDNDARRDTPPPARRAAAAIAPSADPPQRVDYNELYRDRQLYSPVTFADKRILTLVGEFHTRPMSEYLRGIAHNFEMHDWLVDVLYL